LGLANRVKREGPSGAKLDFANLRG
jgi:hypothetical protein